MMNCCLLRLSLRREGDLQDRSLVGPPLCYTIRPSRHMHYIRHCYPIAACGQELSAQELSCFFSRTVGCRRTASKPASSSRLLWPFCESATVKQLTPADAGSFASLHCHILPRYLQSFTNFAAARLHGLKDKLLHVLRLTCQGCPGHPLRLWDHGFEVSDKVLAGVKQAFLPEVQRKLALAVSQGPRNSPEPHHSTTTTNPSPA